MDNSNNIPKFATLTGQLMTNMVRGYSAYEIAVQEGFEGTVEEWLASLVGESVQIEVVEDTENSYILKFTVGDESVITPNLRQNLSEMKGQIQDMQTQVSHHSAEIINLHSVDSSLDQRVTALEQGGGGGGGGSDLAERVAALETSVQTIDSKVGEITGQIESLNSDVSGINSDIENINGSVADLNSNVTDLGENVTNLTSAISGLTNRVSDLETANEDTRSRLRSLETGVSDLFDHIDSLEADITELKNKFNFYIDSTDIDLDQLSEIVAYMKEMSMIEFVDQLPAPEDADPKKIYILRPNQGQEVGG